MAESTAHEDGRWDQRGGEPAEVEPIDNSAEMEALLDRLDRAVGEQRDRLDRQARVASQMLLDEARMGLSAGLPALRVVVRRRPDSFGKLGLVDFAMRAMTSVAAGGKDAFLPEILIKKLEDLRSELAGLAPSPLERILTERIALAWFDVTEADRRWADASAGGCPLDQAEYHRKYRSRANQRFLAACKALATVRRLALPVLQVNLGGAALAKPPRVPGFAGGLDRCLSSRAD